MPGDIERVTFNPKLLFANVELQQGRLLLPADYNEQSAIHHYFLRNLIMDLVGKRWRADMGFQISVEAKPPLKLQIAKGHYYVDGIMCENEKDCSFEGQPFGPVPDDPAHFDEDAVAVCLDCWERHVTCLQFSFLRDPALGGADTATRIQIAWQARLLSKESADNLLDKICKALDTRIAALDSAADADLRNLLKVTRRDLDKAKQDFDKAVNCKTATAVIDLLDKGWPLMAADAKDEEENPEPCVIAADSEYRGRENQLYRVEIHRPGLVGEATFKWSRENGSVAFKVIDIDPNNAANETQVTLESLGHDRRTGLCNDQWVELVDDDTEFRWQSPPLLRVTKIDVHRRIVTLAGVSAVNPKHHAILRRWDQAGAKLANGVPVQESKADWIDLERGVKIRFAPGGLYRTGDYWLIPARVATGDIEWPAQGDKPQAIPPHGIKHHRAVLATLELDQEKWKVDENCPCTQKPLCK